MKTINRTQPQLFSVMSQKGDSAIPAGKVHICLATFETIELGNDVDEATKFAVANWNSPELRQLLKAAAGIFGAPAPFAFLVEAMSDYAKKNEAPPTVAAEGIDELEEHFDMLAMNDEDGDPAEAMLQNCAAIVVAANRLAAVLLKDIPPERVVELIRENQP